MPKKTPKEEQDIDLEETEEGEDVVEEEITEPEAEEVVEKKAAGAKKVVAKDEVIFVNKEKLNRANDILLLVTGKRAPRETSELERKDHYTGLLAARGVKATDTNATQTIYEILGGLVRTPKEQEEADKAAAAARIKHKRRRVEQDKAE